MPRSYMELTLRADEALRERLVALLADLGIEGFWEDGDLLRCYIGAGRWTPALEEAIRELLTLVSRGSGSPRPRMDVRPLEERNWNEEWEKTIRPQRITDRIIVRASWHDPAGPSDACEIIIDPKMSFGTGYHESTRLSLRLLERHVRPARPVLDVGTGTGILAITALKLGSGDAVAVDVDPWSQENAAENARLNGVFGRVRVVAGDLREAPHGTFGTICANIQRDVLEAILPDLARRLEPGGVLILAGLLQPDDAPMRAAIGAAGLRVADALEENEWIALACGAAPGEA